MQTAVEKMGAQLERWGSKIDRLADKNQMSCRRATFEALTHVDELKVLLAIAQSKFDELGTVEDRDRGRLHAELRTAWNDLEAAF